jgi:hypothetical protein
MAMEGVLTVTELGHLLEAQEAPCVSIFLSTHRAAREGEQVPIRFRNLLKLAEERLEGSGIRRPEAKALLEPAWVLAADSDFWRRQSDGLAVYLSSGTLRAYRLPYPFEESVSVGDAFAIRPLLPLLSEDARFFVLALSQNEVRLVEGNRSSAREVLLEGFPTSLGEAPEGVDREPHLRYHPGPSAGRGKPSATFHGQSEATGKTHHKQDVAGFFRRVDAGLHEILRDERAPLLLAGVDYELAQYRELNTYPFLAEAALVGSPERMTVEDLHQRGWELIRPLLAARKDEALARYRELTGTGRVSDDPASCLAAAFQGRVETLFVAAGKEAWGTIGAKGIGVELHDERQEGDVELLEKAAAEVLRHRRTVYALEEESMPGNALVAGIFHY